MIFRIREADRSLERHASTWAPKEIELENYLLPGRAEDPLLDESVFREPLLLVSHQVRTRESKRADILALDQAGCGVVIELKRHQGSLGVDTQALQYLASFSVFKGRDFVAQFAKDADADLSERIQGFLGDHVRFEDVNRRSRIILVARSFDPTLFSMGEWLAKSGVAFRCIEYTPFEISGNKFLSFSVAFDRAPESLYPLAFQPRAREPGTFWHNIGRDEAWWRTLKERGEIDAGFDNQPGDAGERILKSYVASDKVVAYASGHGAVGWGVIERPSSYKLLRVGDPGDTHPKHIHRHRLNITWKAVAATLKEAIPPEEIRKRFDIYHPVSTSVKIADRKADDLISCLSEKFGAA